MPVRTALDFFFPPLSAAKNSRATFCGTPTFLANPASCAAAAGGEGPEQIESGQRPEVGRRQGRLLVRGECPKCGKHIGRGVGLHARRCQGNAE